MTCESANCEDHVTFFHSCYIKLKIINTNNEPHKQTVRNTIHGLHMDCRPQVIHACCVSSSVNIASFTNPGIRQIWFRKYALKEL